MSNFWKCTLDLISSRQMFWHSCNR